MLTYRVVLECKARTHHCCHVMWTALMSGCTRLAFDAESERLKTIVFDGFKERFGENEIFHRMTANASTSSVCNHQHIDTKQIAKAMEE